MSIRSSLVRTGALSAVAFALLGAFPSHDAEACGGFFSMPREGARRPSLAWEQVLLIHDAQEGKEHFIREVTFDDADQAFGFVVPTPTRPEVEKVEKSPFVALRQTFPFMSMAGAGSVPGAPRGIGGGGGAGYGVQVLETKQVGSFTAFVLRADDPGALADWLAKNELVSTPEADRWLAHYVKLKFFYVAMRYDGAKADAQGAAPPKLTSETVRISFATPAPYYPYFEPDPPKGVESAPHRLLDLWVVSRAPVVPVTLRTEGETRSWVRPMRAGQAMKVVFPPHILEPSLAKLVPPGKVSVQTFQDQKVSRVGFGDILFVPQEAPDRAELDAHIAKLRPMLAILDPTLAEAP